MQLLSRLTFVVFCLGADITMASPVTYHVAGCSVIHREGPKTLRADEAAIWAANELGYKLFARDDAHGMAFKNKITQRILTVGVVGADGDFQVESETPVESDINDARLD